MDAIPTILIVDDMPTNIAVLYDLLKDEYHLKAATNGNEALKIATSKEKPDLILLDIEMPEMDGYEVCKELKNNAMTKSIPVIFVTARNDPKDEEYGFNLGAVDYISKPFYPAIVKVRVKTHLEMKLKGDRLEELSMIDGLTNIPNRRCFDEAYEKIYKETDRNQAGFAVMMIDVDYFKHYNDHYGHGKGDECLVKIAAALKKSIKRPTDMVARYGGEEFVVLLKDIDEAGVQSVAQSLVETISNLDIKHKYSKTADHVTISIGTAFKNSAFSKEELLKEADDALYRAKESGKNRYVSWECLHGDDLSATVSNNFELQ